jgi:Ankyrin repeats (3 copies)
MEGFHPGTIYSEIKEVLTDDDGQLRKDWKMTEDRDLTDKHLHEQIVAPGEQVCAIGRWSSTKHGLVPPSGSVIRLIRGDPQQVVSTLRGKAVANIIGCIIVAAIVNGGIFMVLQVAAGKSSLFHDTPLARHSFHGDEMHEAVSAGNIAAAEKLASNGTGIDVRESGGRTPLAMAQDAAMARWLIAHGADVNAATPDGQTVLMMQAAAGRAEIVRALVKAGAKLDTVSTKWHTTALTQALDAERDDVVRILRDAGAKDETVTEAKGQAVREDDPPVRACLAWIDAIQREDLDAMKKVSTFTSFNDIDFKVWKSSRPAHPKLVRGYATENAATIDLRGAIASGVYETWTYQLVYRDSEWRIVSERWETKLSSNQP